MRHETWMSDHFRPPQKTAKERAEDDVQRCERNLTQAIHRVSICNEELLEAKAELKKLD